MYTYNITIKVANNIAPQWLGWMHTKHIPAVMASNCFTSYKIMQLLQPTDAEGPTYIVQYFCNSLTHYDNYNANFAEKLKQESYTKWGNGFIAFKTLMVNINS